MKNIIVCDYCNGTGQGNLSTCPHCNGEGLIKQSKRKRKTTKKRNNKSSSNIHLHVCKGMLSPT